MRLTEVESPPVTLPVDEGIVFADWSACPGDPAPGADLARGGCVSPGLTVGELAERVEVSQSTCSHHVRTLAAPGFVLLAMAGTTTVSVNDACCSGLPHAADVVMGTLAARACCPHPAS